MPRQAPDAAPLTQERRNRIRLELQHSGAVRSKELSARWAVSPMTIRRDLAALESAGHAVRVHGGALNGPEATHAPQPSPDRPGGQRAQLREIAAAAAATVRPGMAIGLVGGPAIELLAAELTQRQDITVVTNSLRIDGLLNSTSHTSPTVILTGGQRGPGGLLAGPIAMRALAGIQVDTVFVDCSGADSEAGLTVDDLAEAELRRQLFRSAGRRVLLAESTVFGARALAPFAPLSDLDAVFTEPDDSASRARGAVLGAIGRSGAGNRPARHREGD
ncbi:DeoR/GlpR family DNA-binding transcription regulator [Kitasatospora azatica]|uniref:DeoR/GlpR family DNA-binding transcription regulator n=1 Tax=Kitasatospora azatica TaxID=58347 RepID=UPI00068C365D|nr:DeoR/GlpR family DNA-binding transcription regulator [Kitasatospora azatica]